MPHLNRKIELRDRLVDLEQTESILADLSPVEQRQFWKLMKTLEVDEKVIARFNNSGVVLARLYKCSLNWAPGFLVKFPHTHNLPPDHFISQMHYFANHTDLLEMFEGLHPEAQQAYWKKKFYNGVKSSCVDRAYLQLLRKSSLIPGFSESELDKTPTGGICSITLDTKFSVVLYKETIAKSANRALDSLDLSHPDAEFNRTIIKALLPAYNERSLSYAASNGLLGRYIVFGSRPTETIMMMRAVYGEEAVTELINKFTDEKQNLCLDHALMLLEAWSEYRDFPAEWICKLQNFTLCSDHKLWTDREPKTQGTFGNFFNPPFSVAPKLYVGPKN